MCRSPPPPPQTTIYFQILLNFSVTLYFSWTFGFDIPTVSEPIVSKFIAKAPSNPQLNLPLYSTFLIVLSAYTTEQIGKLNNVSWEPEGRYQYSKMFRWEPEGHYRCIKSMVIAPFLFSTEHLWILIAPLWLSTDDK